MFGNKLDKVKKAAEKKHIPALIKLAQDKDKSVVTAALTGLGQVKDDDSFNALIPFLSSPDGDYRSAAAAALGEMGNEHAKAFLLHAVSIEKDEKVKKAMEAASLKLREH